MFVGYLTIRLRWNVNKVQYCDTKTLILFRIDNALRPAPFLESSGKYQMFREKGNQSFSSPPGAVKPDPGDFDLIPPDFWLFIRERFLFLRASASVEHGP